MYLYARPQQLHIPETYIQSVRKLFRHMLFTRKNTQWGVGSCVLFQEDLGLGKLRYLWCSL